MRFKRFSFGRRRRSRRLGRRRLTRGGFRY